MKIRSILILLCVTLGFATGLTAQTKKASAWKTYKSKKLGISFSYPSDFKVKTGDNSNGADLIISPIHPQRKSNGEYYFAISKSATPAVADTPTPAADQGINDAKPPKGLPKSKIVGGGKLKIYASSDASAGQYSYDYGYSGIVNKSTWNIGFKENTSPVGNYGNKVHELNTSRAPGTLVNLMNSLRIAK